MRHFRAEEDADNNKSVQKIPFEKHLQGSLKGIIKLLLFVEFAVSYGYAIENVWVTMLMITHRTPDAVDSFVWIVPIVLAVLARPYLIRYVHQATHRVYREVYLVSFFLFLGAVGCYIVGISCTITGKSKVFKKALTCTIGWTLMDIGFELCQFFAAKTQESYQALREQNSEEKPSQLVQETPRKKQNFQFYGLFLGYVVSMLICWIIQGRTVKEFYRCCKYAFWTVGGLALVTGGRLLVESYGTMPKKTDDNDKRISRIRPISGDISFYLPGLFETVRADRRSFLLLMLHAAIVFLNDVVVIYCTMWFSEPDNLKFQKHGEGLIAGLQFGSLALLGYTILDAIKINGRYLQFSRNFEVSLVLVLVASIYSFWRYDYVSFALVCLTVGVANQFYRHCVYNHESESNPLFDRCVEVVERTEKIFVLAVMPPIVMLLLERDDIRDCLLWLGGISVVALVLYRLSLRIGCRDDDEVRSNSHTVKVTKIE